MTESFFQKKHVSTKCNGCIITIKKLSIIERISSPIFETKGTGDILFVFEKPDPIYTEELRLKQFRKWLHEHGIDSYQFAYGIKCRTSDIDIPSPIYKCYRRCKAITEDIVQSKVIITLGRGIFALTQSDDITSWWDFSEFLFNQTYFYTGYAWKKKIRVYPFPGIYDWVNSDNFESYFVLEQIKEVKNYLKNYSEFIVPEFTINKIDDPNEFLQNNIGDEKKLLSWDTETSSLDHWSDNFKIKCLTMSFNGVNGYYFPYDKINKRTLNQFFKNKEGIFANAKYDVKALYLDGIKTCKISEDVVLLHHLLNTQRMTNSIKSLAWLIGFGGYQNKLESYIEENNIKSYYDIPELVLIEYATLDAIVTYRLYELGLELAENQPYIYKIYKEVLIPVISVFMNMELEGIQVDITYLNELDNKLSIKQKELEKTIYEYFGIEFDISSNQQLAMLMESKGFSDLGRSDKQKYKVEISGVEFEKGYYKVGDNQLQVWKKEKPEIINSLLEYRAVLKLRSTYVGSVKDSDDSFMSRKSKEEDWDKIYKEPKKEDGLVKFIKKDGKIHSSYGPGMTSSARAKSSDPNGQNFPKQGYEGKIFRPIFKCTDDYTFVEADYAGFQLRIGAIYSKDETMKDIFINKSGDMHSMTAINIFHRDMTLDEFLKVKKDEPYKTSRFKSKGIGFGFLFGKSAYSFKKDLELEWTEQDIEKYIKENKLEILLTEENIPDKSLTVSTDIRNKFFQTYKNLLPWIYNQHNFAKENGYVISEHGIVRHLSHLKFIGTDSNKYTVNNLFNIAVNSPVQSFEAIVVYKALIKLQNELTKNNMQSKIIAMVHDSIVLCAKKTELKQLYVMLKDCLEDHTSWNIPILIDIQVGPIWGFGISIDNLNDLDNYITNK